MSNQEVFIVSAARTPLGSFQGSLSALSAIDLGATSIRSALERAGVPGDKVDEVYMGNVLSAGVGQAPARQAAIAAGIDKQAPAMTVSKVCGSGLQSAILATRSLRLGDSGVVVAGGMESMSNAPYLLPKARGGFRMGHGEVLDSMICDGLWDPYGDFHMGNAAEDCASKYELSRQAQDDFARASYKRALAAQEKGGFKDELVPVTIKGRRGETVVDTDEEPGRAKLDKMGALRPAFLSDGTITAANASKINDGASALVLASGDAVKAHGLKPIARVVSYAGHAQEPRWFTTAPVGATRRALASAGLEAGDVDLYEINEAFSVVTMACARDLGVDLERTNVNGGAVALGHPIGASGARILTTLLYALQQRDAERGLATLCIGGGEAVAMVVERV